MTTAINNVLEVMMSGRKMRSLVVALLALLLALPAAAQQYGALYGNVVDENGSILPGSTVEKLSRVALAL